MKKKTKTTKTTYIKHRLMLAAQLRQKTWRQGAQRACLAAGKLHEEQKCALFPFSGGRTGTVVEDDGGVAEAIGLAISVHKRWSFPITYCLASQRQPKRMTFGESVINFLEMRCKSTCRRSTLPLGVRKFCNQQIKDCHYGHLARLSAPRPARYVFLSLATILQ